MTTPQNNNTTVQNDDGIVYEKLSTQPDPEPAFNPDFSSNVNPNVPVYMPQSQPMYMPQQQQQPVYGSPQPVYVASQPMYASPQPMYVPQQQQQQQQQVVYTSQPQVVYRPQPQMGQPVYVSTQPQPQILVTREGAIKARMHMKNCCCCFSYPTGVKVLVILEVFVWLFWAIGGMTSGLWWIWVFSLGAIALCYYGYAGADKMIESYLRIYSYYLAFKALVYFVLIYVFAYLGYDFNLATWAFYTVLFVYWYYIVHDFANTIRDFDNEVKAQVQARPPQAQP